MIIYHYPLCFCNGYQWTYPHLNSTYHSLLTRRRERSRLF
nr:MAG TPA: hypothetical protein [Caudoviricetes sp.]